ncbi:MAG: hypothetical protein N2508_09765 [Anaerolineae bacterium]|nr:hypothetical protein [Anaerolineae bacterium]
MKRIWVPIVMVVLATLACSLPGGGKATPVQQPEVTHPASQEEATAVPTREAGEEAPPPEVAENALEGLDSYRARTTLEWIPVDGTPQSVTWLEEHTREPLARRIVVESSEGIMELVQIGDVGWICAGGTCMQATQSQEAPADMGVPAWDPADFTSADYTYKGEETVNGIRARHYVLKLDAAEIAALAQGSISDVQSEVWIAAESGLPEFAVRYQMSWKETRDGTEGAARFSYEVSDVNAPITIKPPENAVSFPEDVPPYPTAADLMLMEGLISFSTTDDVTTVADFYSKELPARGWTKGEDMTLEGMVNQSWTKDGRTLHLMISAADDGKTSVMITLE